MKRLRRSKRPIVEAAIAVAAIAVMVAQA